MNKWIAEFDLEYGDMMPEHMDLNYMGGKIDFHCRPMWIPCSERLPIERTNPNTLDFEHVLCSTTFGDVRAYRFGKPMGYTEPHFWHGAGLMDEYVVAWMPLPEPYEEGEK